jgi:nitroreductase
MEAIDYYAFIFKRKSIRNYYLTPLDENTLAEVSDHLDNLKPLYGNIKIEMKIISSDEVKTRMMKKAPHYIAVFSQKEEDYLTNVGFMMQQMDLFFSANGLGSCWQGIPKPKKEVLNSSNLEFVIVMAFGKPNEPLYRSGVSEFKRKPLHEISSVKGADELLEAARLAPSAINSQPWFFTGSSTMINAYSAKPNFIKAIMVKKYNPIGMGIAIYHLQVAVEHFGKNVQIMFDKMAEENAPKGYEYVVSLKIE